MNVATNTTALLAALGLLAAGPAMAQSTADQPASQTAPSGGMSPSGQAAGTVSDEEMREYARVWRQIQEGDENEELAAALEGGGDLTGKEQDLSTALNTAGSSMSAEEFQQVHRQVQSDPNLRARIEQETGVSTSGTSGADSGTTRPGQGAPLPGGGLGTGPSSVQGGTPPGTQQPGLGTGGAPAPSGSEGGTK